jgi:hypothetical protein
MDLDEYKDEEFVLKVTCGIRMDKYSKNYLEELNSLIKEIKDNIMKIQYVEDVK